VHSIIVAEAPLVLTTLTALVTTLALACRALADGRWPRAFGAAATFATALWILVFTIFRPAIAEQRSLASFMTVAAARATSSGLWFYPPTFDFGAAFYAPYGVGYLEFHKYERVRQTECTESARRRRRNSAKARPSSACDRRLRGFDRCGAGD
jgi:hypothetical protein